MSAKPIIVELQPDALVPLRNRKGTRIACLEGVLWITHDRDPEDILLQPGQTYELTRKGAMVQALGACRVSLEAPGPESRLSGLLLRPA
jgi:hypothetical protein